VNIIPVPSAMTSIASPDSHHSRQRHCWDAALYIHYYYCMVEKTVASLGEQRLIFAIELPKMAARLRPDYVSTKTLGILSSPHHE
jgi:hypothetical protein